MREIDYKGAGIVQLDVGCKWTMFTDNFVVTSELDKILDMIDKWDATPEEQVVPYVMTGKDFTKALSEYIENM